MPEGEDARIVEAALRLKNEKIAQPILLGPRDAIASRGTSLDGIEIIDPRNDARLKSYGEALCGRAFLDDAGDGDEAGEPSRSISAA